MAESNFTKEAVEEAIQAESKVESPEAVKSAESVQQPQGKVYTEDEVKAAIKTAQLEVRREGTKREQRLKELEQSMSLTQRQANELVALRQEFAETQDLIATFLDKQAGAEEPENVSMRKQLEQRRQAKNQARSVASSPQDFNAAVKAAVETSRLDEMVAELGLATDDDRMYIAQRRYGTQGFDGAMAYLKSLKGESEVKPGKEEKSAKPKTAQERIEEIKSSPDVELPKSSVGSSSSTTALGNMTPAQLQVRMAQPDGIDWMIKHEKEVEALHSKWTRKK